MTPDLQPDVPLLELFLYAVLNPATIAVAFLMGRNANEKSKVLIAAFIGAVAGVALLYLAALLRIWDAPTLGRAAAGVFAASLVAGLIYARIGYAFRR
jgi:ABC-type Co2+ transport system permease subunit